MFCTGCGSQIPDSSKFCTVCGQPVPGADAPDAGAVPPGQQLAPNPHPSPKKGLSTGAKVGIGVAAVAVAAAVGIGAFLVWGGGAAPGSAGGGASREGVVADEPSGPSDEELVQEVIAAELDVLKDSSSAEYQEFVSMAAEMLGPVDEVGVDAEAVIVSILSGYDYEITDVAVDDDMADVEVTVTAKDMSAFEDELVAAVDKSSDLFANAASEEEVFAIYNQLVQVVIENLATQETDITLTCTKTGADTWEVDEPDVVMYVFDECFA